MDKILRLVRYDWPLHFTLLFTNWLPDNIFIMRLRGWLISPYFNRCGRDFRVARNSVFYNSFNISFGSHVFIANGNWFSATEKIDIADEVMFGPACVIISMNHSKKNGSFRYGANAAAPISIGKGCWIGGNCSVLSGAIIGEGTVIGANSVARGIIPANVLYAGNPGRVIKDV